MAAADVTADPCLDPPPPPNPTLDRVGSLFSDPGSASNIDSGFYVLGSISRLCNEVDDITLESGSSRTVAGSDSPQLAPLQRVATAYDRETPVFSWDSRTSTMVDDCVSLEDMLRKRRNPGSSLAPQSSSDPSDDERSEAPSVGQFRPDIPLIQCPVQGCERVFKWKKNLHHHIRDKHPTDAAGLSVMRIQPAHVGAAHNGFRLQNIAIAPPPNSVPIPPNGDPSLRCPECHKIFSRKGDLVHHKRYHTRSNERPYKCEQCGQGFIHLKDLARHMPRHTGQRSFQCPFPTCHKNYTRKDNLNRHMRHDHGGLGASDEVWSGVDNAPHIAQPSPIAIPMPVEQPGSQQMQYEPQVDHAVPVSSHLTAIAAAATNHTLLQEDNMQHQQPLRFDFAESSMHLLQHDPTSTTLLEPKMESSSSEASMNGQPSQSAFRETTPSLGKRPADDLERLATGIKPKRKPKEKWAHRLGCPFRKCRSDVFTTENGFRVCETTPHEFIIRLIEHMKRNHDLYVCGECFLGFKTPDTLNSHKSTSHHCGKCYMSFPSKEAFVEHAQSCMAVDAATQEDIWQILYETLCGDGVRHNPSFDEEDGHVAGPIQANNRVRMQLLAQTVLAPGQVPSLARQLGGPPLETGNGVAPPVRRAEYRQQFAPVGATTSPAAPDRASSPPGLRREAQLLRENQAQRDTIQELRGLLAMETQTRFAAEVRVDAYSRSLRARDFVHDAVRRFLMSMRRPNLDLAKPLRYGSGLVEELPELCDAMDDDDVVALVPSRTPFRITDVDPPSKSNISHVLPISLLQASACELLECPSLTSDQTAESVQEFTLPPDIGRSFSEALLDMHKNEISFTWSQQPWDCQLCGAELQDACDVFCKNCALAAKP
ncbi:uncharacterized protein PV09_04943 [Verruconis gallopava]|uniref:C2H2-type domain-containing protein n=1 Tax=Verruconis gallopava TaxID=253628 RepID=A0A0D2ACA1_9PEZI|nr:uncharacterized protein PV09_04943 [Verruconis gallopava]KIW04135.1 hypothetical protein PV09_04943 [Verruconis gallopava]